MASLVTMAGVVATLAQLAEHTGREGEACDCLGAVELLAEELEARIRRAVEAETLSDRGPAPGPPQTVSPAN